MREGESRTVHHSVRTQEGRAKLIFIIQHGIIKGSLSLSVESLRRCVDTHGQEHCPHTQKIRLEAPNLTTFVGRPFSSFCPTKVDLAVALITIEDLLVDDDDEGGGEL